ncbi:hemicentin-1-like [Lytechinus variegatus]|uniref:hemicentin-1-like n=1 Tax=Lytechinus variegatus TaxID=7654 RepID=UPI001BB2079A|nr:hemicentin-1-like [Lytechinus variegatus]
MAMFFQAFFPRHAQSVILILCGMTVYAFAIEVAIKQTGLAILGRNAILRCHYRETSSSTQSGLVYWNSDNRRNFISGTSNSSITNNYRPQRYQMWFDGASNGVLKILNVGFDDEMTYTCGVITESGSGVAEDFELIVLAPPSHVTIESNGPSNSEVVVVSGQSHSITCASGSSKPSASITWSKVDANFDLQLHEFDQSTTPSESDDRMVITQRLVSYIPMPPHDKKKLRCAASHPALSSPISSTVTLRVMVLPRDMRLILKETNLETTLTGNLDVDDGDTITFQCLVLQASPAATISWRITESPGDTIDGVTRVTDRGDGLMDTDSHLQLVLSSEQHHNRLLTCEATLRINSKTHTISRSVTLRVHGPPNTVTLEGTNNLLEGAQSSITCSVPNAFPEPRITWDIDGRDVTGMTTKSASVTDRGRFTVNSSLPFDPQRSDNGKVVTCGAIHSSVSGGEDHVTDAAATLDVHYCPSNITATCPVVRDGDEARVRCSEVISNPATVVRMFEHEQTIPKTLTIVKYRNVTSPVHGVKTKVIYERQFTKDSGPREFRCCTESSTICPNICHRCRADIQYPPEVYRLPEGQTLQVTEGDSVNLTCCADANPTPEGLITWIAQGRHNVFCSPEGHSHVIETVRGSTGDACSTLTFEPVTTGDAGIHECMADNGFATSYSVTFELQVKFPPCATADQSSILLNDGSDATLLCDVISNPPSEVTWYFNNQPINTSSPRYQVTTGGSGGINHMLIRSEIEILGISASIDAGNYSCMAYNSLGNGTSLTHLQIATVPDPPTELQAPINSVKETSLLVEWKPGYNGGKEQTFRLAYCLVASMTSCLQISNLRNNTSFEFADTLKPYTLYAISVWSINEVGESTEISINASTKPLSPSDLEFEITYSPSQGVVIMQSAGGSAIDGAIPNDLCIRIEVNLGQDWVPGEGCLEVGVVKTIQRDLLEGQLRGVSCGRELCSIHSSVKVQNSQGIPWTIIIIISGSVKGMILLILIVVFCWCICRRRKNNKETIRDLKKTASSDPVRQSPSSWYQPLSFRRNSLQPPALPPDRPSVKSKTDPEGEDPAYEIPDQTPIRTFMYDDTSPRSPSAAREDPDVADDGYIPMMTNTMTTFTKPSIKPKPPKPLPKPSSTYDNIRGGVYENLRI